MATELQTKVALGAALWVAADILKRAGRDDLATPLRKQWIVLVRPETAADIQDLQDAAIKLLNETM